MQRLTCKLFDIFIIDKSNGFLTCMFIKRNMWDFEQKRLGAIFKCFLTNQLGMFLKWTIKDLIKIWMNFLEKLSNVEPRVFLESMKF